MGVRFTSFPGSSFIRQKRTEAFIHALVRDARTGMRVAYVGNMPAESREVRVIIESRQDPEVEKIFRANGQERIKYKSGGEILFLSPQGNGLRGIILDALAWDAQEPISEDACIASKHIYRLVSE